MFVGTYLPYPTSIAIGRAYKHVIMHGGWAPRWQTKYNTRTVYIRTGNMKRTAMAGKWGFGGKNTSDEEK